MYLAATNQVVSAALVAEREADDEPATAASASSGKQGASPTSSGPDKDGSAQMQEEVQKKKMVQRECTLSVLSCRGLGQGTLVCRNCFLASLWPRESCTITSKHTRSQLSLAFR